MSPKTILKLAEGDLSAAEMAALIALVGEIQNNPSPTAAAKRAGVAFEYPPELRGLVVSVKLPRNPNRELRIAVVFDGRPCCAIPSARLRNIDNALLHAADEADGAIAELTAPTESTRREAIRLLKMLNRSLLRSANLAHRLSQAPPAGPLPWSTAGAVFYIERAA